MRGGALIQGRYVLEEVLGRGGMAEVWLAHDNRLDRPVAIKFLARHFGDDPEHLVRFFAEAQSVARIQHASVAAVLDFGESDGYPFLVMYHLSGGSLAEVIGRPIPPNRGLEIAAEIAAAAGAAHALGIVHRDIKPANVLLDESGNPKLADFGIASLIAGERLTATGKAVGSPHYISPEQALSAGTSPASDVYALGIVLFEMLTGRRPFQGDSVAAVVVAQVEEAPSPPSAHVPGLDSAIDALVLRCLAKDPEERFSDGNELAEAIRSLMARLGVGVGVEIVGVDGDTAPLEPVATAPGEASRPRFRAAAIALPALLLVTGAGFKLLTGQPNQTDSAPGQTQETSPADRKQSKSPRPDESTAETAGPSPTPSPRSSETPAEDGGTDTEEDGDGGGVEEDPEPSPVPSPSPTAPPSPVETPSP